MADPETIEKVHQEIMRFRELLNIMREKLDIGERAYSRLFANCRPDEMQGLKEKDLQKLVARRIADDPTALRQAVGHLRFEARNLERAFEELYDIIVMSDVSGGDDMA
ncbi:MAG TPA: hypothetical protein VMT34_13445 [Aggregatilineales bacterium]|nr:hypothetical protein [Aggregatilineales bacterium]